ncbi:MAG: RNA polymerase sigma factor RpoD, partial [Myxococcales bacterium]|nr:RNA polymerase sigma factor RpoD [Myxococcales bacterium]
MEYDNESQSNNSDASEGRAPKTKGSTSVTDLDPVKMYLKRIGTVSLLDREGEVAIAKRIEEGRIALYEALFSCRAGVKAL